jgi:hypothetical protein
VYFSAKNILKTRLLVSQNVISNARDFSEMASAGPILRSRAHLKASDEIADSDFPQGQDPHTRRTGDHVLYETSTWQAAFEIEYAVCRILPQITYMATGVQWSGGSPVYVSQFGSACRN